MKFDPKKLIESVQNPDPPLWSDLCEKLPTIEDLRRKGYTHRQMAAAAGVTESAWHRALKKAKKEAGHRSGAVKVPTRKQGQQQERDDLPPLPGMRPSKSKDNLPFQNQRGI